VNPALAVVNCGQVVTLRGPARPRTGAEMRELGVVENGALLVREGRIEAVGSRDEIERRLRAGDKVVDAQGRIALPGFVDAHTHPVFAGTRCGEFELRSQGASYEEIAAAGGGILETVRQTRRASEDELFEAALRHQQWFLRNGTTTVEAKSGYGLTVEDELKILRVIGRLNEAGPIRWAPTFLGAHAVPEEFRGNRGAYVELVCEAMLPAVAAGHLARYCDAFCEPSAFSIDETRRVLTRAASLGLGLRLHADQLTCSGAAELAASLGAATADHLEQTSDSGIAQLLAARVQPVLLPASVYALGRTRYARARDMIEAGLAIVLATDFNPGSSPTPSMPMVLSLACTQMHLTAAEAITAATINAAWSLGLGCEIGSLEPGKRADILVADCADYRELPYFFGVEHAWVVLAGGEEAFRR
jgi:imidazolonepropionase